MILDYTMLIVSTFLTFVNFRENCNLKIKTLLGQNSLKFLKVHICCKKNQVGTVFISTIARDFTITTACFEKAFYPKKLTEASICLTNA